MNRNVNEYQRMDEEHPYNMKHPIPELTKTLIVGTAPPPRFSNSYLQKLCGGLRAGDACFYYGSEDNYLWWEIFSRIQGDKLFSSEDDENESHCIETMKTFLTRNRLWMRDILQRFTRKNICSANDTDIVPYNDGYTDFRGQFKAIPSINKIAFTSEKAAEWTFAALGRQCLLDIPSFKEVLEKWGKATGAPKEKVIERHKTAVLKNTLVEGREIDFYILPTPTGRSSAGLKLDDKIEIYKSVLFSEM